MQRHDPHLGQRVQAGRDAFLSGGALRPGGGALARAVVDSKESGDPADEPIAKDSPDVLLLRFDAGFIASLPSLVFTPGRAAGRAAIEVGARGVMHALADQAVNGAGALRDLLAADRAGPRIAQVHLAAGGSVFLCLHAMKDGRRGRALVRRHADRPRVGVGAARGADGRRRHLAQRSVDGAAAFGGACSEATTLPIGVGRGADPFGRPTPGGTNRRSAALR
jgi:hypothetical protein